MILTNIEDVAAWDVLESLSARDTPFAPEDADAAVSWVQALYIPTIRDRQLAQAVARTSRQNGATKRHWLCVDGVTNTGKSEMLLRFAMRYRRTHLTHDDTEVHRRVPIIMIQADPGQLGAGVLRAIADFAGVPTEGNEDKIRRRLAHVLPSMHTDYIVVDDGHMLTASSLAHSLRASLRIPATFIYAGANMQESALLRSTGTSGNESTDQLRSRHTMLHFEPLSMPNDSALLRQLIGDFVKALERIVPHLATPFRRDNKALSKLVTTTRGQVGSLMGVLKDATVDALHDDAVLHVDRVLDFAQREFTYDATRVST